MRFLAAQYTERDGERQRLIGATWGIFGHGNVAGIGQALIEYGDDMPYHQGRNEQAMVHAAVGVRAPVATGCRRSACTTSIGPGATNLVTGAALATINRLPVLLLPGDTFATRPADPVLQQLEDPTRRDVSVNDCLRPVSRYFDRVSRPEALITGAARGHAGADRPRRDRRRHARSAAGRAGGGVRLARRVLRASGCGTSPRPAPEPAANWTAPSQWSARRGVR